MMTKSEKVVMIGKLKDDSDYWDKENFVIDNDNINTVLRDFKGRNVQITIEEINNGE